VPPPLSIYLPALLLTLLIEIPIVLLVLYRRCGVNRALLAGLLASGITHPALWFLWPFVVPLENYELFVATGEALVVVVEAVVIHAVALRFTPRYLPLALGTSLLANLASYGAGLWIQTFT